MLQFENPHELNALKAQSPAFDPENDRGPADDNEFIRELVRRMDHFAAMHAPRAATPSEPGRGGAAL